LDLQQTNLKNRTGAAADPSELHPPLAYYRNL
jgi:hypothetical protein